MDGSVSLFVYRSVSLLLNGSALLFKDGSVSLFVDGSVSLLVGASASLFVYGSASYFWMDQLHSANSPCRFPVNLWKYKMKMQPYHLIFSTFRSISLDTEIKQ